MKKLTVQYWFCKVFHCKSGRVASGICSFNLKQWFVHSSRLFTLLGCYKSSNFRYADR